MNNCGNSKKRHFNGKFQDSRWCGNGILVGSERALVDVSRGGFDGDDVDARRQRRDVEGVVRPIDLRGKLDRVGHRRGNFHVIVTYSPATVDDDILCFLVIIIKDFGNIKIEWQVVTSRG